MSGQPSTADDALRREVYDLGDALLSRAISDEDSARLARLVSEDSEARRHYIRFMHDSALLGEWGRGSSDTKQVGANSVPVGLESQVLCSSLPSLSTTHYPLPTAFVDGPVFSYMVASVVLCLMLLSAWAYKITHIQPFMPDMANSRLNQESPVPAFVGKITGMKNCRWVDGALGTMVGASVPLGRKYSLESGLLQITYKTGANVIIEGPCVYEVDSKVGGYLGWGKLTARVKSGGLAASAASAPPQAASPLFSVTTPTAVVTDLGTEFGIEVNGKGDTISHVFRGTVRVRVVGEGHQEEVLLHADESARVAGKSSSDETALHQLGKNDTTPKFVRRMAPLPKTLDLLDIVVGGNGTGHRRERGIDPATGREDSFFIMKAYHGADDYQPIVWHSLIDGIFVPKRNATTAQLDSAGHTFDGFDFGTGGTVGSIWARAAEVKPIKKEQNRWTWVYTMAPADKFMPSGGGLLCLHANAGITFDLAAMRKMFDGARPSRFRATAGMATPGPKLPDPYGKADLWIFVDGRLEQSKKGVQIEDEAIDFDVEIGPEARFLTIVSTDAKNGCNFDWVVFGEPILEMTLTEHEQQEEENQP